MCTSVIQVHICGTRGEEVTRRRCEAAILISQLVVLTELDRGLQLLYRIECDKDFMKIDKVGIKFDCEECLTTQSLLGEYQAGLRCIEMEQESRDRAERDRAERV